MAAVRNWIRKQVDVHIKFFFSMIDFGFQLKYQFLQFVCFFAPSLTGLRSFNNFVGSLKYVFYNDVSILYELNKTNPKVHYIGVLEPAFEEENITVIPMTFPFPSSHFWWRRSALYDSLSLTFEFKSSRNVAVLASSEVKLHNSTGIWEVSGCYSSDFLVYPKTYLAVL